LWQNPQPSLTQFCKSIRFQFVHKTIEIFVVEKQYIENKKKDLILLILGVQLVKDFLQKKKTHLF